MTKFGARFWSVIAELLCWLALPVAMATLAKFVMASPLYRKKSTKPGPISGSNSLADKFVDVWSLQSSWERLTTVPASPGLALVRLALTFMLLLLHCIEGGRWEAIDKLERDDLLMKLVRPLALVNELFILLSVYLQVAVGRAASDRWSLGTQLQRVVRKYMRQVPVYLFWIYLSIYAFFFSLQYNKWDHRFPWWSVSYTRSVAVCMEAPMRFGLLSHDVLNFLGYPHDGSKLRTVMRGNPCFNMWIFNAEFWITVLLLPVTFAYDRFGKFAGAVVSLPIFAYCSVSPHWTFRMLEPALLFLFFHHFYRPTTPAPLHLGIFLLYCGFAFYFHGQDLADSAPPTSPLNEICLKVLLTCGGLIILRAAHAWWPGECNQVLEEVKAEKEMETKSKECVDKSAKAVKRNEGKAEKVENISQDGTEKVAKLVKRPPLDPARWGWLAITNLCFSVNVSHQFVQLYVEFLNAYPREYSPFIGLTHVIALGTWCIPVALVTFALVQHPAERLSSHLCSFFFPLMYKILGY